jgi:hypothetical protein
MHFFFLDVVDVVPARSGNGLDYRFYLIVALTILAEAVVMLLIKYNRFGKSLLYSFLVNTVSVATGFLMFDLLPGLFDPFRLLNLLAMLLITIAIELPVLWLLNKPKVFRQTVTVTAVMNAVSYTLFYIYIMNFTR